MNIRLQQMVLAWLIEQAQRHLLWPMTPQPYNGKQAPAYIQGTQYAPRKTKAYQRAAKKNHLKVIGHHACAPTDRQLHNLANGMPYVWRGLDNPLALKIMSEVRDNPRPGGHTGR